MSDERVDVQVALARADVQVRHRRVEPSPSAGKLPDAVALGDLGARATTAERRAAAA